MRWPPPNRCWTSSRGQPRATTAPARRSGPPREFADGGPRAQRLRVVAPDAHRAGKSAPTAAAAHAAYAAGDAAASAFLHPFPKASQVGHILRAAAHAACVHELRSDGPSDARGWIETYATAASPTLLEVLGRYPPAPSGRTRVAVLMRALDAALRARARPLR